MSSIISWIFGTEEPATNGRRGSNVTDDFVDAVNDGQQSSSAPAPNSVLPLPMLGKPLTTPGTAGNPEAATDTPIHETHTTMGVNRTKSAASHGSENQRSGSNNMLHYLRNVQGAHILHPHATSKGDLESAHMSSNIPSDDYESLIQRQNKTMAEDSGAFDYIGGLDLPDGASDDLEHRHSSIVAHFATREHARRPSQHSNRKSLRGMQPSIPEGSGLAPDGVELEDNSIAKPDESDVAEKGDGGAGESKPAAKPELPFGGMYIPGMPTADPFVVYWEGKKDPENPRAWPQWYRAYLTFVASFLTIACSFASSAPAFLMPVIAQDIGTTIPVMKVIVFLYVGGFCVGPLLWAPLSEQFGQRYVFLVSMIGFCCMNIGCALSPNTAAMLIFRFLAGSFSASPLTNSASLIAGLWSIKVLGNGIGIFAIAPMAGPCLGPIAGGYIMQHHVHWRWIYWSCVIISGVCVALILFTLPETHAGYQLRKKAIRVRKETGDDRYYAPIERRKTNIKELLLRTLLRPIKLFIFEPMLQAVTVYISFVYGTLYLLFEAYPAVFLKLHRMKPGPTGLTFLGYFVGCLFAVAFIVLYDTPRYKRKLKESGKFILAPEERLMPSLVGAPILVASLFWFAWTSFESISIWSPIVAGGVFGAAMLLIFLSLLTFITEAYFVNAASALAANTVVRSAFGIGFPMFGEQMYTNLNPRWASTVLAFIALAMLPIPYVLIKFGPALRARAKFAN